MDTTLDVSIDDSNTAFSFPFRPGTFLFKLFQPSVRLTPLNLHSARSFHLPSVSISNCFHNGPRVVLSPLKDSMSRKYLVHKKIVFPKRRKYPHISKCNTKRCRCCKHLVCESTVKSTVNGRTFSVRLNSDVDCNTSHVIYVLT